jgi:hypothetical protein
VFVYYFIRKSAANARRPGTSHRAIAVSIFALISLEADGLRPIACIAPIPISPIPTQEPITPISAKAVYIVEKGKNNKWFQIDFTERKYPVCIKDFERKTFPEEQAETFVCASVWYPSDFRHSDEGRIHVSFFWMLRSSAWREHF